jgi:pyridoxamine 5'-phosphate oxidase
MIKFLKICKKKPYVFLKEKYNEAIIAGQKNIEAISISSYSQELKQVDSRYVNLKFITDEEFIFFTNYNSPKALSFQSHNQIAALLYWPSVNLQIRMKANIKRTSNQFNQEYFINRSKEKNALAISSNQSKPIGSFTQIKEKYNKAFKCSDLNKCPEYWGGFSFTPFEIEFWEGNEYRLNKRNFYKKNNNDWDHCILEP